MDKDILLKADNYIFDVRAVGVLVRDGKLLVQREREGSEYALPGGHVKLGETSEEAIIREYKEETGAEVKPIRLLWTEECFWEWKRTKAHNLAFYYLIELSEGSEIHDSGDFVAHKDNSDVLLGWMPLDKLPEITIYPEFIVGAINDLNTPLRHFVSGG